MVIAKYQWHVGTLARKRAMGVKISKNTAIYVEK